MKVTARSVEIEWDPPDSDVPLTEYEVWSGYAEAAPPQVPRAGLRNRTLRTVFRVTGLAQMTRYQFRVRAKNNAGWSAWSACSEAGRTSDACSQEDFRVSVVKKYGGTVTSAWRAFDRDGDGVITREEFCMAFDKAGMGAAVPMEHRLKLFAEADERGCGKLTYREFAQSFAPYKATPGLARHLMPEVPEEQRQEVTEEICHGCSNTGGTIRRRRVDISVERLTTPRSRLRRTRSEGCFSESGSTVTGVSTVMSEFFFGGDTLGKQQGREKLSESFPYRPRSRRRGSKDSYCGSVSRDCSPGSLISGCGPAALPEREASFMSMRSIRPRRRLPAEATQRLGRKCQLHV